MFDECESEKTNPSEAIVWLYYALGTCIVFFTLTTAIYFGWRLNWKHDHDENGKQVSRIYTNLSTLTFILESACVILVFSIIVFIQNCPEWYIHKEHNKESSSHNSHDSPIVHYNITNINLTYNHGYTSTLILGLHEHDHNNQGTNDHAHDHDEYNQDEHDHDHAIEHGREAIMFESIIKILDK